MDDTRKIKLHTNDTHEAYATIYHHYINGPTTETDRQKNTEGRRAEEDGGERKNDEMDASSALSLSIMLKRRRRKLVVFRTKNFRIALRAQSNHVHLLIVDNGFVEKHSNLVVQQATCRTE